MIKYLELKSPVKFPCDFEIKGKTIKKYLKFSNFELNNPIMIFSDTYGNKAALPKVEKIVPYFNDCTQQIDRYDIHLENGDEFWIPKENILLTYEGEK